MLDYNILRLNSEIQSSAVYSCKKEKTDHKKKNKKMKRKWKRNGKIIFRTTKKIITGYNIT